MKKFQFIPIGKPLKIRTNVPGAIPVKLPRPAPQPQGKPILVPDWPQREKVVVPPGKSGGGKDDR